MPDMSEKSSPAAPHDEAPILQGSAAIAPTAAGLAAKANDLEAIRDAVVDAAKISAGLWLSYLFVLFYLFVAAGGVTHKDLFLESPVKLPFLNVDLPILVYFWVGPAIFLVVHAYVLLHFRMLTGKVRVFDQELRAQIDPDQDDSNTRARLRRQLPNDIFVQFLAGPPEVRRGVIGALLKLIAWISLVLGPIALLGLFELQFLAYHSAWITWWQRFAMSLDLVLLWLLWPAVVRNARGSTWRRSAGWVVAGIATVVSLFLVFLLAIFPGEWLQLHLPLLPLQKQLVAGPIDQDNVLDAHRANSLWSYRLVLTGFNGIDNTRGVIDHTRVDTQQKIAPLPALRTRDFRSAVFIDAGLPKVDFTAANLKGTDFYRAHLEGANFTRARLEGAVLTEAHLEGAVLTNANFEGALLPRAYLQGADLSSAHLEGADLSGAHLEGAVLTQAQLEGANLNSAHLEGANLSDAHLEGALFKNAQLQGTLFIRAFFWRNDMSSANDQDAHIVGSILEQCPDKPCDWTAAKLQSLRQSLREQEMPGEPSSWSNFRNAALSRINKLDPASTNAPSADAAWEQHWRALEQLSSNDTHKAGLIEQWRRIGCSWDGSPYVLTALTEKMEDRKLPFWDSPRLPTLAAAFLDPACAGGRGMSEATKAKLEQLSKRAVPQDAPAP